MKPKKQNVYWKQQSERNTKEQKTMNGKENQKNKKKINEIKIWFFEKRSQ